MTEMIDIGRFRGCLLGLACGDAVGTSVEFRPRGTFEPITDMIGGGPFRLEPGQWTDDTSMALCLAVSLIESEKFDPFDQMKKYCKWMHEGYLSSTGRCFDIGNTIRNALSSFEKTGEPFSGSTHPRSAGNGCIMRLAPVPMYFYPDKNAVIEMSGESSKTTHGAQECIESSKLFGGILFQALAGKDKKEILLNHDVTGFTCEKVKSIAEGDYRDKSENEIRGTGYVIHCLEAALWCFLNTDNFKDAILRAVNLGDDADTTAAVCGQIAGAYYGEDGISETWLEKLAMKDFIKELADKLYYKKAEKNI